MTAISSHARLDSGPRPTMLGPMLWARYGIGCILLVGAGCTQGSDDGAPKLRTSEVERRALSQIVEASGHLEVPKLYVVTSAVEGRVTDVLVEAGDEVEAGQALAHLDPRQLELDVSALEATRAAARARAASAAATLEDAEAQLARAERLAKRGQTSEAQLDAQQVAKRSAEAMLRAARAEVEAANARLAGARQAVSQAEVPSPAKGVVLRSSARIGMAVGPSGPVLFELAPGLSPLEARADVGEADVGRLAVGQRATVSVPAFPDERFPAEVRNIGLVAEMQGGSSYYPVFLSVPNREGRLRPGMSVAARFEVETVEDALVVREAALRYAPDGVVGAPPRSRVFVKKNGGARAVAVEAGVSDGAYTEVRPVEPGALSEGDAVVIGEVVAGAEPAGLSLGGG